MHLRRVWGFCTSLSRAGAVAAEGPGLAVDDRVGRHRGARAETHQEEEEREIPRLELAGGAVGRIVVTLEQLRSSSSLHGDASILRVASVTRECGTEDVFWIKAGEESAHTQWSGFILKYQYTRIAAICQ